MTLAIGDSAPLFELIGIDGETGEQSTYRLADFRGAPVILAFYPADNSPVCTKQLVSYTQGISSLKNSGAKLLALSPQDPQSHLEFAKEHGGFAFPLLSDVDKSVGRDYGILGLLDLYRRSVVMVDAEGIVVYTHRSVGPGLTFRPLEDLAALIAKLG